MATQTIVRPEPKPEVKFEEKIEKIELRPRYPHWPTQASGILNIVSGGVGIVAGVVGLMMAANLPTLPLIGAYFVIALGIVSVIGGIASLVRRNWGLALTGSILSTILIVPFGTLSLIFVTMGRKHFENMHMQEPQTK